MIAQAQVTIVDLNDPVQQGVAPENPTEGLEWLDTSPSPPQLKRYDGTQWQLINEADVGGTNLIADSASYTLVGTGAASHWVAADELRLGREHSFSVEEIWLDVGSASGVSWA